MSNGHTISLPNPAFIDVEKLINKKLTSKLFARHSSGNKRRNKGKKILIDFVIKLNEDDWMLGEASQHMINARVSSCKQTLFGGISLACMI